MNHYNIRLNFIEYFSILSAIPHRWKLLIRGIGKINLIENDIVDRLKRDSKACKYFSKQYMLNVKMFPVNGKRKFIQGLLLKIGVSFTVYVFLLQKILNYRTFIINLYIES
jgi:hypothetical protein